MFKYPIRAAILSSAIALQACSASPSVPDRTPQEAIQAYVDTIKFNSKAERNITTLREDTIAAFGPENTIGLPEGSVLTKETVERLSREAFTGLEAQLRSEFVARASEQMEQSDIDILESALLSPELVEVLRCYEDAYYAGFNESWACEEDMKIPDDVTASQRELFTQSSDFWSDDRTITLMGTTQCDLLQTLAAEASSEETPISIEEGTVRFDYLGVKACDEMAAARQAFEPDYQPL